MSAHSAVLEAATIRQQCKMLHLPTVAAQCAQLAEQAVRERRTHLGFLEALLQAELEEREHRLVERRVRDAHLPRMKTLEEFDFAQCPNISVQQIHELAEGGYIGRAEPIIFIGDSGTGKTHLLTGLAVAACRQKRRVRFATAAAFIVTTNLPFSEWTQVIPNARLCKALLDRITDRAHIIQTGTASYRFRRTLEKRRSGTSALNTTTAPPPP